MRSGRARFDRRIPPVGIVLKREHRGSLISVEVLTNGFEYQGRQYRSLSAIASEVTGTRWNGLSFLRAHRRAPERRRVRCYPKPLVPRRVPLRCAIYTRKSTEEGLEQEFNSLDAQREAAKPIISSQRPEGWVALPHIYDDGGFTGANMDRPALKRLLADVEAGSGLRGGLQG